MFSDLEKIIDTLRRCAMNLREANAKMQKTNKQRKQSREKLGKMTADLRRVNENMNEVLGKLKKQPKAPEYTSPITDTLH